MNDRRATILRDLAQIEMQRVSLFAELVALNITQEPDDELLTVEDAARVLKTSTDWLYRHADDLPFTVRPGPGQVRFSRRGTQEYLKRKQRR